MNIYKKPRELNWVVGVTLLLITTTFGFSGYLLPWDQLAFWATKIGTGIAGSIPVIGVTLPMVLRYGLLLMGLILLAVSIDNASKGN